MCFLAISALRIAAQARDIGDGKTYFAIGMQGKIVGYSEDSKQEDTYKGSKVTVYKTDRFLKMSLLGRPVDQRDQSRIYFDHLAQRPALITYVGEAGPTRSRIECHFAEESARCEVFLNQKRVQEKEVALSTEVLVPWGNEFLVPPASSLPAAQPGQTRRLSLFYLAVLDVSEATLTFEGEETLRVKGEERPARRYLLQIKKRGTRLKP